MKLDRASFKIVKLILYKMNLLK